MAGEIDGYSIDKRWIRKDGQIIDATISVKCLRDVDGSVDYFVALLQDVTAHKRAEEASKKVEMILDSITDRFFAFDSEWRITHFNKHGEEQLKSLGRNPASFIGKVLWEEFPDPPIEEVFRRAMRERGERFGISTA